VLTVTVVVSWVFGAFTLLPVATVSALFVGDFFAVTVVDGLTAVDFELAGFVDAGLTAGCFPTAGFVTVGFVTVGFTDAGFGATGFGADGLTVGAGPCDGFPACGLGPCCAAACAVADAAVTETMMASMTRFMGPPLVAGDPCTRKGHSRLHKASHPAKLLMRRAFNRISFLAVAEAA
jgi:hypothetical protein